MRQRHRDLAAELRLGPLLLAAAMLAVLVVLTAELLGWTTAGPAGAPLRPMAAGLLGAGALAATASLAALALLAARRRQRSEHRVAARLDAIMENAAGGLATFDRGLQCVSLNQAFADLLGPWAGSGCIGMSLWELLPGERAQLEPAAAKVLDDATRVEGIAVSRRQADGSGRDWLISLYPLPGPEGSGGAGTPPRGAGIGLIAVEVTAQRAAERRLAFQLQLEEQLRDLADPLSMKHAVCELIARRLGAAQASYAEIEEPFSHIIVEGGWTDGRVAQLPGRRIIADHDVVLLDELKRNRWVAVADVQSDPRIPDPQRAAVFLPRGIAAFAMVMLLKRGSPSGIVLVSDAVPRPWSEADMALLSDAAERSWSAIARGRAALALKDSEQRFQRAISGAGIGIWDWDLERDEVTISRGFLPQVHDRLQGASCAAADFVAAIHPDDRARMADALRRVGEQGRSGADFFYGEEYRTVSRGGTVRWLRSQGRVTQRAPSGRATRLSGVTVDITERRRAEEALTAAQSRLRLLNQDLEAQVRREVEAREQAHSRLAQTQRLEALAQLSGGIAHDFNNVLQAITGSLALIHRRAGDAEVVRQLAGMAGDAAARGGAITARLLSFARQGELQPMSVPPAALLHNLLDMLDHMLGAGIVLRLEADDALPPLFADKGQLEAVLVNLALNARDAMPDGGTLTVSADVQTVGPNEVNRNGLPPGAFVRIAMTDTGVGMKPAVLARASEPFFTTKPVGQGTGLGLAMARGFAEQSGGAFMLSSVAGAGTTVSIWLPLAAANAVLPDEAPSPAPATTGSRPEHQIRLLLVDDDPLVREVLAGQMEELGYRVSRAQSGPAALARLDAGETPDLMITDYAMPGMNGAVLLAEARRRLPQLPVLLLTGFADNSLRLDTAEWDTRITMLLRKPVSSDALAKAASAVLQQAPAPAAMVAARG